MLKDETDRASRGVEPADREFIREAVGSLRYEPLAVLDRCRQGHPRVVLSFHGDGISKTAYWLSCPSLIVAVSALESAGAIDRIEAAIGADPELSRTFARSQELYRRLFYLLFRQELSGVDPAPYLAGVRGVGGVSDARFVKCLHAQVAFTLATGRGPAGAMALTELGFRRDAEGRWDGPVE